MSSRYDLSTDQQNDYEACLQAYKRTRGFTSIMHQSLLVDRFKEFGKAVLLDAIEAAVAIDARSMPELTLMCSYYKKYGKPRVDEAMQACAKMGWKSLSSLEGVLSGAMKPVRKLASAAKEPPPKRPDRYPLPDGRTDQNGAAAWLSSQGYRVDQWPEFYELSGQDDIDHGKKQLYRLKEEYR